MNDLRRLSKEDLEQMMTETETCIRDIRAELQRRQQQAQHEAVDALEVYLEQTKVNWHDVKAFFQHVLRELRR